MVQYYTLANIKGMLREKSPNNDDNLNILGRQADSIINRALSNIEPEVLASGSLSNPPQDLKDLSDQLALGLFWFTENGDKEIFDNASQALKDYIEDRYHRPIATTRGARGR